MNCLWIRKLVKDYFRYDVFLIIEYFVDIKVYDNDNILLQRNNIFGQRVLILSLFYEKYEIFGILKKGVKYLCGE